MRSFPKVPLAWDTVVFLLISVMGFILSVNKLVHREISLGQEAIAITPIEGGLSESTLNLGCLEQTPKISPQKTEFGSIRFKGALCERRKSRHSKKLEVVSVKNITNGYEGTIFLRDADTAFVTDYMILSRGMNKIQIQWQPTGHLKPTEILTEIQEK